MAIKDTIKKPYIVDNDSNISIGLDLPIRLDNSTSGSGYFATTDTTIEAVKNNIRNLLNTNQGERLMQPNLGLNLRQYLFEHFDEDMIVQIKNDIADTFRTWLPFVSIQNIAVFMDDNGTGDIQKNKLSISIHFRIQKDPTTLESIEISLSPFGDGGDNQQIIESSY